MRKSKSVHFLAAALMFVAALPAMAAPKGSKTMGSIIAKGHFALADNITLNGATLTPGEYNVVASDSTVSFFQGRKLVAEGPIRWQDATEKFNQSAVVADSGKLQEVRFKGQTRSAVVQ